MSDGEDRYDDSEYEALAADGERRAATALRGMFAAVLLSAAALTTAVVVLTALMFLALLERG
ncbi:hypothetical protein ACIRP2_16755 [Streptomyces sp. NPDC101194]|uniref:hypothetical protein n=1 Tax=Streptomyces sp. NPDC101194 TaxID=3366127 RepID=UPI003827E44F